MKERTKKLLTFATTLPSRARGVAEILFQDPVGPANISSLLEAWAKKDPDRTFLLFERERITFGELERRVRRRARTLAASTASRPGVRRGDAVALMMNNHPQFLVNAWAIARLGAVVSLVNTNLTGKGLAHAISQTNPRAIIAGREHLPVLRAALEEAPEARAVTLLWEETRQGHGMEDVSGAYELPALDAEPAPEIQPAVTLGDDVYAYIFTSGTTGLPKAGKISHARAFTAAYGFGRFSLGLSERDVLYVCLPLFHSSGFLIGAGSSVLTGATLALSRKLSVSRFWDEVCDSGATAFVYIGEVCRYLLNAPPHPRERAHRLTRIVGNGMRPDVWKGFVDRFRPGIVNEFYGATEGNVNMTNVFGLEGSVGRMPPIPWLNNAFLAKFDQRADTHVRDAQGLCVECKAGEVGELLGRIDPSRVTMRFEGYLGDASTDAKILRNVKERGDAYFRSGDLLRRDWLGFYYFVDRIGDTFRWKGENVSTIEVGDVCGRHDGVEMANVYGVSVPGADGRAGMAALSLSPGAHFSPDRFYEHVMRALPPYAAPLFVRLLSEQNMTATFKLKKNDLQREGFDPHAVNDHLFYRDDRHKTYQVLDDTAFDGIKTGGLRL
ncbi:MAG: long-chain-acyl-CoA synthetase [Polyangiaceae bacterium]|nr:long-chain-acyl-CoA synthetase [Polyangiaceae bacterium]